MTPPTQPTIETVLQRISQLGEGLRTEMNQRIDSLEQNLTQQIAGLRAEMVDQFTTLTEKVDIVNRELLDVKAQQERQRKRIDGLERKAS